MIFLDTETIGLHGLPVLLQYAYDDGEIELYNFWYEPINDTLELLRELCYHEGGICGFNLAFDWFHICKIYTIFSLLKDKDTLPMHQIDEVAKAERHGCLGLCLKPISACDLMLHARKGLYQSTMNRSSIIIKRVPTPLSGRLADALTQLIPLKDIYFANKTDIKKRWQIQDIINEFDDVDPNFKNVLLRFSPSSALKALAVDALGYEEDKILKFINVSPPSFKNVKELGYAPFAEALGSPTDWKKTWVHWAWDDILFWETNKYARRYAELDVQYTRELYKYFGSPEPGDVDSNLACMVAAVRWHGYSIDLEKIKELRDEAQVKIDTLPFNVNSPQVCKKYIQQVLSKMEYGVLTVDGKASTKKVILEEISKWAIDEICDKCDGLGCDDCDEGVIHTDVRHPAAIRSQEILDARSSIVEIGLFNKLLIAKRFHASFKVIGALSSRMSGSDGLNAQGINRAKHIRSCFTLADEGYVLCRGDFDAFEMSIMDAAYRDPKMHKELSGDKKIHALWGNRYFFPSMTYNDIIATKSAAVPWEDFYNRSKQGVFAVCYFGEGHTLITRVGIPESTANDAYQRILVDYPVFAKKRQDVTKMFCSMSQVGGIGSKVEWLEPADYIESLLGFKRYFTLENRICKVLFDLAEEPPKEWNDIKIKVRRRDRIQSSSGATRSALFAAAFSVQSSNMRAAGNHRIQSTGAEETKKLEHQIWEHQPVGINEWRVIPMQIHDEIVVPVLPAYIQPVQRTVKKFVETEKSIIPLIGIDWKTNLKSWSGS